MAPPAIATLARATGVALVPALAVVLTAAPQGRPEAALTATQAAGRTAYAAHCASCHGAELRGAEGPPLAGAVFLST